MTLHKVYKSLLTNQSISDVNLSDLNPELLSWKNHFRAAVGLTLEIVSLPTRYKLPSDKKLPVGYCSIPRTHSIALYSVIIF